MMRTKTRYSRPCHWGYRRINENLEQLMKSVPAHVVKTEKDFLHVALDLKDA